MKAFLALLALAAVAQAGNIVAPATYVSRAPAFDSALIQSHRLGGSFSYSVNESPAYQVSSPIVQHVTSPVAVSYSAPALATYAAPATIASYAAPVAYSGLPYPYAAATHIL